MSSVLEFPGCRQHYKGRHSLLRQPVSQMSEQGSENSDGRWCQALMADESVPTGLWTCSGTLVCSRGQGSFLPCTVVGGYMIHPAPSPPPHTHTCISVCTLFLLSFLPFHPALKLCPACYHGLSCLIHLFSFIVIRLSISPPHLRQPF